MSEEEAPNVVGGLTCYESVDAARALALPWPDLYYSPAWGAVELATGAAAWELVVWWRRDDESDSDGASSRSSRFVAYAYAKRPVLQSDVRVAWDLRSPYGYSGPWSSAEATPDDWAHFRRAFEALCRDRGYVSEFVRFSPLFPAFAQAYAAAAHGRLATRTVATVAVDLSGGAQDYWRRAAKQHRNKVRKASNLGVTVSLKVIETSADIASFAEPYRATMDRRAASRFYYFDEAYYATLFAQIPRGDSYYATATARDGALVSAAIFLRHGDVLHYHLSASHTAGYAVAGPSAILDAAARLGVSLGCATLHLGGGIHPGDSLSTFKRAVGDVVLDWTLGTSVLDRPAFDELLALRAAATHTGVADLTKQAGSFFPPYRAGLDGDDLAPAPARVS